jgi:hypothetical protein
MKTKCHPENFQDGILFLLDKKLGETKKLL